MNARHRLIGFAVLVAAYSSVPALNTPAASDGPVRLLNCVVSSHGVLQAEVDNQSDDAQYCNIRCNYDISGQTFTHWFGLTVPKRFSGRIGEFDTNGGKAGNFSGEVGTCKKNSTD